MERSFAVAARSVIGLVRSGNEDSALIDQHLLAVADGMGGHAGGEVASAVAIRTLANLTPLLENHNIDVDSIEDLLINCLDNVDEEIRRAAKENIELTGMGTTLTALALYGSGKNEKVAILHVGDSRCYRLRGNTLTQLSHDHTVLQELLDQGAVSVEEALEHPQRSFLTQALMGNGPLSPVLTVYDFKEKDRFLLCSDGLSGFLSEKEIKAGLKIAQRDLALSHLIDAAYSAGAPDNVTVVIADITTESQTNSHKTEFLGAAADA